MMTDSQNSGTNWGLGFLILLIFFAIFSGGRGVFGAREGFAHGGGDCGCSPCGGWTPAQLAETSAWHNLFQGQAAIKCDMDRNDAILKGDLELGFRTVINNADNNKNDILLADERRENQNLRDRVLRLEADGDKKDILLAIERSKADTDARIASVACNMLTKPQVTGIGCSPCVVSPCDARQGGFC